MVYGTKPSIEMSNLMNNSWCGDRSGRCYWKMKLFFAWGIPSAACGTWFEIASHTIKRPEGRFLFIAG